MDVLIESFFDGQRQKSKARRSLDIGSGVSKKGQGKSKGKSIDHMDALLMGMDGESDPIGMQWMHCTFSVSTSNCNSEDTAVCKQL